MDRANSGVESIAFMMCSIVGGPVAPWEMPNGYAGMRAACERRRRMWRAVGEKCFNCLRHFVPWRRWVA